MKRERYDQISFFKKHSRCRHWIGLQRGKNEKENHLEGFCKSAGNMMEKPDIKDMAMLTLYILASYFFSVKKLLNIYKILRMSLAHSDTKVILTIVMILLLLGVLLKI